jgi:plastocyanin
MNRSPRILIALILVGATAACAPAADEPGASSPIPSSTQGEMASDDMASDDMASDDMASHDMASDDMASHDMGDMGGSGQSVTVDIANFAFEPMQLTIEIGTEVTFTNSDAAPHTVTAGSDDDPMPDAFDSGLLQPGDTFSFVFTEAGEFPYYCERHPPMTGTIVVEG